MKTFKELHESIKTAIDEVIVTAKDDKQRSGVRKTGLTVKAGVDDDFAKKHNQAPYFSVTHNLMKGNSNISDGIASASHIKQLHLSPEHTGDLMKVQKMHLRSAIDGSPSGAQKNAEYHAGIGKYAPKGGNAEHLAHHLGTHLEHAQDIIDQVNSVDEKRDPKALASFVVDEKKKGIVKSAVDSLRPEWQKKADEANAAIDRLSKAKLTTNESIEDLDESVKKLVQGDEHDKPWHEMTDGARELALHGENDSSLYHSSYVPSVENLKKKIKSGKYDRAQVPQLAKYHAERAADSYAKEHGSKGDTGISMFTPEDRKQAAHYFASTMHSDAHEG